MTRFLLLTALLCALGCSSGGPPLPKTYPAAGIVVFKSGKPMTGGSLELTTTEDTLLRVVGTIDSDGHFTLSTRKDNSRADGAPAGEYRVMVQPPLVTDARGGIDAAHKGVPAITLPAPLRLDAKENTNLRIELPGP
jgi:hypothetical protein